MRTTTEESIKNRINKLKAELQKTKYGPYRTSLFKELEESYNDLREVSGFWTYLKMITLGY